AIRWRIGVPRSEGLQGWRQAGRVYEETSGVRLCSRRGRGPVGEETVRNGICRSAGGRRAGRERARRRASLEKELEGAGSPETWEAREGTGSSGGVEDVVPGVR